MLPNILSENLVCLADAANLLAGRPHVSTLCRWQRVGLRGVVLQTCRIGGRRFTSHEALRRFLVATNSEAKLPTASKSRRRAIEQARRHLEMAGIRQPRPAGGDE